MPRKWRIQLGHFRENLILLISYQNLCKSVQNHFLAIVFSFPLLFFSSTSECFYATSRANHPFIMLTWIGNLCSSRNNFTIEVSYNIGNPSVILVRCNRYRFKLNMFVFQKMLSSTVYDNWMKNSDTV